jgi:hypothetical protein
MMMREIVCVCVKTDIVVTETVYKICSISHIYSIIYTVFIIFLHYITVSSS